ncbi:ROK family transcriptional regulator [Streptomyces sp. MP131-18]|uniref:ROK family transcriptional regulator n=1 Tax=Streptomyces sp. MP131-18 TaxID=1857892 RepID=UPI0009A23B85|nr:ROK family transcriptional regulator [Streptomyces sp. MP131-18]ONK10531.1 N-acetylglucosamine repressor [Streptomyces sp. MP131-18]
MLINGPQTRTSLAKTLGLSTGSLTRLTKPLVQSGLLVERDVVHDPVNGRPTRPLDIVAEDFHFLGIKLTSDHVHAAVTDLRARVVAEAGEPIGDRRPESVLVQARNLMTRLSREGAEPVAAGFALGGNPQAPGETAAAEVFDAPFLDWWGIPLQPLLDERMGIPCVVSNDVSALAHSQHWFGAARGLSDFALVTAGAGIGYALFIRDHMVTATESDLREFSHHILDPGGPMCPEGHRGCVASYLSTHSILTSAAHGLRRQVTIEEITRMAREGDAVCLQVTRQAGWALGAVIATVVNITMVKTVVVAGESVEVARAGKRHIERGMGHRRHRDYRSIDIPMLSADFTEWARGGAVAAIRTFVAGTS